MKMTNALTTFMLLTTLSFSSLVLAEEIVIPVIAKPSVLQEGTQRELTADQITELLPWAKNSKVFLNDLLNSVQGLSSVDKLDRFESGIKTVVGESAPKNSELLMRYVLNRGLVLNELLKSEVSADEVGAIDTKLRVLTLSIKMAITYYDIDLNTLSKKANAPFITFGIDYFSFLSELNKSIFDASASYNIQRTALEWLQWDLYRDLNNQQMAAQIVKINNSLKIFPVKKMSDNQYISYIRQMKLISNQLDLKIPVNAKKIKEVDEDSDSLSTGGTHTFNESEIMSACSQSFAYNSNKTTCFSRAKNNDLDPGMIRLCGSLISDDSGRLNCLELLNGVIADSYNTGAYTACGNNLAYNSNKLVCMELVNKGKPFAVDISACGQYLSDDSSRIDCMKIISNNALSSTDQLKNTIKACGNNFAYNSNKIQCISIAIENQTKDEDIMACGSSMGEDSERRKCIENIGSQKLNNSKKIIGACGNSFAYNSYKSACVEIAFKKELEPSSISSCGKMASNDDSRLTCVKSL